MGNYHSGHLEALSKEERSEVLALFGEVKEFNYFYLQLLLFISLSLSETNMTSSLILTSKMLSIPILEVGVVGVVGVVKVSGIFPFINIYSFLPL